MESSIFVQSERLVSFLRFTVETTLNGKAESLKEYVIGTHVYGRKSSYQPAEDSIGCGYFGTTANLHKMRRLARFIPLLAVA
jgi:hypothetical protein